MIQKSFVYSHLIFFLIIIIHRILFYIIYTHKNKWDNSLLQRKEDDNAIATEYMIHSTHTSHIETYNPSILYCYHHHHQYSICKNVSIMYYIYHPATTTHIFKEILINFSSFNTVTFSVLFLQFITTNTIIESITIIYHYHDPSTTKQKEVEITTFNWNRQWQ